MSQSNNSTMFRHGSFFVRIFALIVNCAALTFGQVSFPEKRDWLQHPSCRDVTCGLAFQGEIWLGSEGCGIVVVQPSSGEVMREFNTGNSLLPSNHIIEVVVGPSDQVWVATTEGLAIFKDSIIKIWHLTDFSKHKQPKWQWYALGCSLTGEMWVGIYGVGVFVLEGKNWVDILDKNPGFSNRLLRYPITSFAFDSTGSVWIGVNSWYGGPDLFSLKNSKWKQYAVGVARELSVDRRNRVWAIGDYQKNIWCVDKGIPDRQTSNDSLFLRSVLRALVINGEGTILACGQNAVWELHDTGWVGYHHPWADWKIGYAGDAVVFKEYDGLGVWMWDLGQDEGADSIWLFKKGVWKGIQIPAGFRRSQPTITGLECAPDGEMWSQLENGWNGESLVTPAPSDLVIFPESRREC